MPIDFGDDDSSPTALTDDEKMAVALMGQMSPYPNSPAPVASNGAQSESRPAPIPIPAQTPSVIPRNGNGNDPNLSPYQAGLIPQPPPREIGPPIPPPTPAPASITQGPLATVPTGNPPPRMAPNPYAPPQIDMAARDKLVQARDASRAPVNVQPTKGDYFRAIIAAGLSGYGRDEGAIGRGIVRGQEVLGQRKAEAQAQRDAENEDADLKLKDFDEKAALERQQFEDRLKGEGAETQRLSEQNRARAEDRQAAAMNTEIDRSFNGGKPLKIKGADGKDEWVVRTKSGAYVPTEAPEEKPYKSAYERSQSKDPKEAAQGRKDYQAEESRRDQRVANDTTRANAAKERADRGPASAKKDPAVRNYNTKLDKERKTLQQTTSSVTAIPNWQSKPMLRNQVAKAYDDFNENTAQYYKEYQDEAGDTKNVPEPARLPYPWEKGGGTNYQPGKTPQPSKAPASATSAASGKGKPVDTYTSKGGTVYKKGDTIKGGKYDGKKILQVYDSGQMDLQ